MSSGKTKLMKADPNECGVSTSAESESAIELLEEALKLIEKHDKRAVMPLLMGIERRNWPCFQKLDQIVFGSRWRLEYTDQELQAWKEKGENGDRNALFFVGYCHLFGRAGFSVSRDQSFKMFAKGAALGHTYCLHFHALCLLYGWGTSLPLIHPISRRNQKRAIELLFRASKDGCPSSSGRVGEMYKDGAGRGPQDFHTACVNYQKGASYWFY